MKFHEKFYSADAMKLCVLGKEDLDTLEVATRVSMFVNRLHVLLNVYGCISLCIAFDKEGGGEVI